MQSFFPHLYIKSANYPAPPPPLCHCHLLFYHPFFFSLFFTPTPILPHCCLLARYSKELWAGLSMSFKFISKKFSTMVGEKFRCGLEEVILLSFLVLSSPLFILNLSFYPPLSSLSPVLCHLFI